MTAKMQIRPAVLGDEAALFDICLKTADAGGDASTLYSDPRLPGFVWAAPYLHYDRDLVFVVADGDRALGYVLGVHDTDTYNDWLSEVWWPKLRVELKGIGPKTIKDHEVFARLNEVEGTSNQAPDDYPAHMHIDLLPEAQSGGWGRKLIDTLKATMKNRGVVGLHLGVDPNNKRAIGFYEHIGFKKLSEDGLLLGQRLN